MQQAIKRVVSEAQQAGDTLDSGVEAQRLQEMFAHLTLSLDDLADAIVKDAATGTNNGILLSAPPHMPHHS